eukprot:680534-Rhodomonas_salina.2
MGPDARRWLLLDLEKVYGHGDSIAMCAHCCGFAACCACYPQPLHRLFIRHPSFIITQREFIMPDLVLPHLPGYIVLLSILLNLLAPSSILLHPLPASSIPIL